jgi:hypothetical protein
MSSANEATDKVMRELTLEFRKPEFQQAQVENPEVKQVAYVYNVSCFVVGVYVWLWLWL